MYLWVLIMQSRIGLDISLGWSDRDIHSNLFLNVFTWKLNTNCLILL